MNDDDDDECGTCTPPTHTLQMHFFLANYYYFLKRANQYIEYVLLHHTATREDDELPAGWEHQQQERGLKRGQGCWYYHIMYTCTSGKISFHSSARHDDLHHGSLQPEWETEHCTAQSTATHTDCYARQLAGTRTKNGNKSVAEDTTVEPGRKNRN